MDWDWWERAVVGGAVIAAALVVAKLADRALARRLKLAPEALTRYGVLRRSIVAAIAAIGVLSALLVIPEVRAVAGSILASSALVGLVIGLAAHSTLANFIAGILIAVTQPLRLGDEVEVAGGAGTVEEIGLTYTVIRMADGARLFVPNQKLASDSIRNATISTSEHLARASVSVPISTDLDWVLGMLVEEARAAPESMPDREPVATVSQLDTSVAVVTLDAWAAGSRQAESLAAAVRRAAHRRLRAEGVFGR